MCRLVRIPYAALVVTHVVETLVFVPIMVGIMFFLFEFFSDQLLAFMVLSGTRRMPPLKLSLSLTPSYVCILTRPYMCRRRR